ncbi:MAG TPA: hypothetical protein VFS08_19410, partial [Gemmatimonadaceae bacterium]|nr:hypothetical protein [Gemmatimonadaceae bacterium]
MHPAAILRRAGPVAAGAGRRPRRATCAGRARGWIGCAALLAAGLAARPAAAQAPRAVPDGIEVRVPAAPALVRYGGASRL